MTVREFFNKFNEEDMDKDMFFIFQNEIIEGRDYSVKIKDVSQVNSEYEKEVGYKAYPITPVSENFIFVDL